MSSSSSSANKSSGGTYCDQRNRWKSENAHDVDDDKDGSNKWQGRVNQRRWVARERTYPDIRICVSFLRSLFLLKLFVLSQKPNMSNVYVSLQIFVGCGITDMQSPQIFLALHMFSDFLRNLVKSLPSKFAV